MDRGDPGPDWIFVGGITFAVLSTVAFAAFAVYVFTGGPP